MSLDALAPDQRAVVQLVLQQERSYEDLAGLLGITADAVRERAHRGLDRLAPTEGVSEDERAAVADYLLGQQSVSRREATRSLLTTSNTARAWAQAVRAELAEVARTPLPEVPADDSARIVEQGDEQGDTVGPLIPDSPAEDRPVISDPLVEDEAPTRARPRPRRTVPDYGFDEPAEVAEPSAVDDAGRTSRLGGALLIAGLGIFVAALIVWLVTRDDDSPETEADTSNTPAATGTPEASATPSYEAAGQVILESPDGGAAKGRVIVYIATNTGDVAFNVRATEVPETQEGQAYGVWLVGGDRPHFLGFAPPVGGNGRLAVSGPRDSDAANFAQWLSSAKRIVVSTETQEGARTPGEPIVLSGEVAPAATPTP